MNKITIEPLKIEETEEASALLSLAYSPTPLTSALFGDPCEEQLDMLEIGFRNSLKNSTAGMLAAKDGKHVIGLMGMTMWPDCHKRSEKIPDTLPAELVPRYVEWKSTWSRHDPPEPHCHLGPMAVLPDRQKQGIGSLLLKGFCEHVDGLGQAGYLETDKESSVRLYKRFGFEVVAEKPILSVLNRFMWRPARSE